MQRTFRKAKRIAAEKQLKASVLWRFVASFHEWVGLYNQKLNTFGLFFYSPKSWDSFNYKVKSIDIEPGDTYVTLTYDRFGEYVSVQVPLTGEDVP